MTGRMKMEPQGTKNYQEIKEKGEFRKASSQNFYDFLGSPLISRRVSNKKGNLSFTFRKLKKEKPKKKKYKINQRKQKKGYNHYMC